MQPFPDDSLPLGEGMFSMHRRIIFNGVYCRVAKSIDLAWTCGTGAPKGPFRVFDTVGIQTAYNIVMQYQKVPGLVSPLLKKMMMPYNFKAMAAVLKKMLDEGKLGESSGEGFFKY